MEKAYSKNYKGCRSCTYGLLSTYYGNCDSIIWTSFDIVFLILMIVVVSSSHITIIFYFAAQVLSRFSIKSPKEGMYICFSVGASLGNWINNLDCGEHTEIAKILLSIVILLTNAVLAAMPFTNIAVMSYYLIALIYILLFLSCNPNGRKLCCFIFSCCRCCKKKNKV